MMSMYEKHLYMLRTCAITCSFAQVHVDGLVKVAYANWHTVTECGSGFLATEAAYKSMNLHYSANEGMRMIGCSSNLNEQSSRNGHSVAKPPGKLAYCEICGVFA
jgi:hypothetical protein